MARVNPKKESAQREIIAVLENQKNNYVFLRKSVEAIMTSSFSLISGMMSGLDKTFFNDGHMCLSKINETISRIDQAIAIASALDIYDYDDEEKEKEKER